MEGIRMGLCMWSVGRVSRASVSRAVLRARCAAGAAALVLGTAAAAVAAPSAVAGPIKQLAVPAGLLDVPAADALSPNGSTLYVTAEGAGTVVAVPVAKPAAAHVLIGGVDEPAGLAIAPNGKHLYVSTAADNSIGSYPLNGAGSVGSPTTIGWGSFTPGVGFGLAVSPNGHELAISDFVHGAVLLADLTASSPEVGLSLSDPHSYLNYTGGLAFSANGKRLYISSGTSGLAVADVSGSPSDANNDVITGNYPAAYDGSHPDYGVALSPDGATIYVSSTGSQPSNFGHKILAISAATHAVVNRFSGFTLPGGIAISPTGSTMYVVNSAVDTLDSVDLRAITVRPTLSGRLRGGSMLHVHAKATTLGAAHVKLSYRWLANGKLIRGAVSPSLKLRHGQLGKHVSVRVTAAAPGLVKRSLTSKPTGLIAKQSKHKR